MVGFVTLCPRIHRAVVDSLAKVGVRLRCLRLVPNLVVFVICPLPDAARRFRMVLCVQDTCIQARLYTAGQNVSSFDELERHAPMTLGCFVQGYRAVVAPIVV